MSKTLIRLIVCLSGKQRYIDEDHADGAIDRGAVKGVQLRRYHCPDCDGYHVSRVREGAERIKRAIREAEHHKNKR